MSRKVDTFRQQIANPQNIHNFLVDIPELGAYGITIQSTSYPSEMARVTTLYIAGEPISYPTVPENSHRWPIRIPENDSGTAYSLCEGLRKKWWDQKTGAITVDTANTTNGQVKFSMSSKQLKGTVNGLKSAAYTESSAYATSAQGAKADSAIQVVNGTVSN